MSYILDALKKAERDRLREEVDDIDDLSGSAWDPYASSAATSRSSSHAMLSYGLMLALVVVVLLAIGLYWETRSVAAQLEVLNGPPAGPYEHSGAGDRLPSGVFSAGTTPAMPVVSSLPPVSEAESRIALLAAPELIISGSLYVSEGSASNRIFVGANVWKEGDTVDTDWIVYRIGIEAVELRSGERRIMLKYP